ncbi:DUF58 domain-containing protein [Aeoliella mucimassa]|uniref:DUF58 domain-containing protein n=1 Tax=Aeoliella mucimassa TaxID=2527972 RepID=A0A518AWA5_9BACT|nr:DUF58 domain-containing protein [Aeoliella mucimassa]QDU59002.1 hypothetical protein Pan181_52430 [Aeoliella mucimassa]
MIYVFWILGLLLLVLIGLARWGGTYPHRPLVMLLLVPSFLSIWIVFLPNMWPLVVLIDTLLAVVALIDLLPLTQAKQLTVERHLGLIASLGQPHKVSLTVVNRSSRQWPVWIRDGVVEHLEAEPSEFNVVLPAERRATLEYHLRPRRRGAFELTHTYLRVRSPWGFWSRYLQVPCHSRMNVYPDMKQLGEYALLARTNRLSLMGLRRTRRVGQDNEFERLRDYTIDDNYRHIEWRSTARRNKLTVKDFQANQSQRVMFMVDCGRMMTGTCEGVSLLDHALNAMLMLSYVALARKDQVGLMCFSNEIHTFVPPKGGSGQMNHLLHAAYDRFPQMVESRYDDAFLHLAAHVRKRTLVVLITNVIDDVNAHQIEKHLTAFTGRHLPMAVLLRDHSLYNAVDAVDHELQQMEQDENETPGMPNIRAFADVPDDRLYQAAGAADILTWRRHVLADLEMKGVLLVDAFPEQLTGNLVNRYLEVKARHLL